MKEVQSSKINEEIVYKGKWLNFKHLDYKVGEQIIHNYEMVERTTLKKKEIGYDCVDLIPLLKNKQTQITYLILIANYRPPVDRFVLEFPGGIMDDENLGQNALRELKEETGYTGKILQDTISPILFCDPWKSNESCKNVIVNIDEDLIENQNPQQNLEKEENIRVHKIPIDSELKNYIHKLCQENQYYLQSQVWTLAVGLTLSQQLKI